MKLSDIRGEQALEVLADLLDPFVTIVSDPEVRELFEGNSQKTKIASTVIKKHKHEVITIMAILDGENPETYKPRLLDIPIKLINLLNDPDVMNLFTLQAQNSDDTSSASALENIQD